MPIFRYYNPYNTYNYNRRGYFYNNYRPAYGANFTPEPVHNNLHLQQQSQQAQQTQQTQQVQQTRHSTDPTFKDDESVWLDLFGIKLYFDDVLILSLLFFLYKEEVKDEGLFLALVLLLIS